MVYWSWFVQLCLIYSVVCNFSITILCHWLTKTVNTISSRECKPDIDLIFILYSNAHSVIDHSLLANYTSFTHQWFSKHVSQSYITWPWPHLHMCYLIQVIVLHCPCRDSLYNIIEGPSWPWSYGSCIYNYIFLYLCNQCLSPLMLWVRI